jgi:hypothetical protein
MAFDRKAIKIGISMWVFVSALFWDESTAREGFFNKKCGTLLEKSRNLEATEAITVDLNG